MCRRFEPVPQVLKKVRFRAGRPLADAHVAGAIEDGRAKLGKNGRLVVRASGTEPLLRIYAEAASPELVQEVLASAESFVQST